MLRGFFIYIKRMNHFIWRAQNSYLKIKLQEVVAYLFMLFVLINFQIDSLWFECYQPIFLPSHLIKIYLNFFLLNGYIHMFTYSGRKCCSHIIHMYRESFVAAVN